ncbi:MAG: tRNA lysidine(34) synthetase TilS [Candidatus Omnitrophica bacterium]|nr:tRNA lysidine(34) synthetase TilS [Candidatus Omnitrophota bacterium]MDD5592606.1 tRNA lysidine(34) synthetase TilS [Candidatus Omnitrophota bacterium]
MFLEKVKDTIKRYNLIAKGDRVLVGVSGGPDSLALLYLLNDLKRALDLKLHIAHLDHCLREDSRGDRIFVEGLARKLKLPVTTAGINVRQLAKRGGSLEEIARNARLGFLFKAAKDTKSAKIALGHNLDDQAETVLMRILRGAGLYGLSGISPKRKIRGYEIIRPLIETRRSEIEAYLKKKKIKPRIDKSNLEDIYFRNKIRNRLLPLLEKEYNRNIREVLSNMAQSLGCDYDYLLRCAERRIKGSRSGLNLRRLKKLHPALQRLMLRMSIAKVKGDTRRITFQHIKEIEDLIYNRPVHSIVDLPKGVSVVKSKSYLSFFRKAKSSINT